MNLNPIDFTYIDGENIYPLQDYVDEQISQLSSAGITTCNVIIDNQKLNDVIFFSTSNLYLKNKISNGDIFISPFFNYPDNGVVGVKVDYTGKLLVYHNYNLLQPTFGAGYYDVEGEIIQLKADGINTDLQLTGLEAAILSLQNQIDDNLAFTEEIIKDVNCLVKFNDLETQNTLQFIGRSTDFAVTSGNYSRVVGQIKNIADNVRFNAIVTGVAISATIGLAGAAISSAATYIYYQNASNTIYNNSNFTINQKNTLYNANTSNEVASYSNYNFSMCNLNFQNGFINCNIITQQFIHSLRTNAITLNGEELTTKFGNYLLKEGGTMTGRINMNTGLYGTPTPAYSTGDRITLNPSSSPSTYPYSIGINTNNLWHCVPSGASYNWYIDNISKLSLSSTSLTVNNNINITSSGTNKLIFDDVFNNKKIQLNSTNGIGVDASGVIICSSGAIRFANSTGSTILATVSSVGDLSFGGTIYSGAISTGGSIVASSLALGANGDITTVRNITASGLVKANSFTENNISLASKYLKLDGTNAMAINANIALTGTGGFIGDGSGLTALNYNNITYNALSFQTPLSKNAANQVSIDLSAYSPTSVNDARYLRLNGANEMANTLNIRILNQYAIDIQTIDSTSPNCIAFKNNTTSYGFIGLPGTTYTGNYANNLFLQTTNAIIFNSGSITSTGTPKMIIMAGGNIGIGTTNALQKLHIQGGATTAMIRIETNTDAENQTTGIEFGIPSFTSVQSAKITSTSLTGNKSDLKFYTRNGTAVDAFNFMTLSSGGDLVISAVNGVNLSTTENRITTNGSTLCGVFSGDTLLSSYWGVAINMNLGGTGDNPGSAGNTKIQGTSSFTINTRTSALSSGFDKTLFTVRNSGNVGIGATDPQNKLQVEGNFRVYNGAGQIRGVSSFAGIATSMATGSLTIGDTSKNFGGSSGWNANTAGLLMECQNNTEIAIHDADTRIASFMYYAGGGTNQFYIGRDMGWGAIAQTNFYGNIQISNSLTNKLIFDDFTNNTKIQLFTGYGFGINASTLRYDTAGVHKFNTNNNQTFIIDADGNTRASGNMVASAYSTASRYYCSATTLLFTSITGNGTYYGWFLSLNGYWATGYSYLTISASVNMAGSGNIFCWNGRVYLSASGGLLTNGGVLQITTDYSNPSSGGNAINVEERWDGWGNNFLRFYGTNLNAGVLTIKVYG